MLFCILFLFIKINTNQIHLLKSYQSAEEKNKNLLNKLIEDVDKNGIIEKNNFDIYIDIYKNDLEHIFKDKIQSGEKNKISAENPDSALLEILEKKIQDLERRKKKTEDKSTPNSKEISEDKERKNESNNKEEKVDEDKVSKMLMDELNEYRESQNLSKIKWNEDVYQIAKKHSYYMEEKNHLSHDHFTDRMGGNYLFANENVAMFGGIILKDHIISKQFMKMWKESPGHDANMKEKNVNQGAIHVLLNTRTKKYFSTMILVKV